MEEIGTAHPPEHGPGSVPTGGFFTMMTSRQRLRATLDHRQPDRVCVDLGATFVSGAHASAVSGLLCVLKNKPLEEKGCLSANSRPPLFT